MPQIERMSMANEQSGKGSGGRRSHAGRKPKSTEGKRRSTSANLPPRSIRLLETLQASAKVARSRSDTFVFALELFEQAMHALQESDDPKGWLEFTRTARVLLLAYQEGDNSSRNS